MTTDEDRRKDREDQIDIRDESYKEQDRLSAIVRNTQRKHDTEPADGDAETHTD